MSHVSRRAFGQAIGAAAIVGTLPVGHGGCTSG